MGEAVGNPNLSAVRGIFFEQYAHRQLRSGVRFRVRSLELEGQESGADQTESFGQLQKLDVFVASDTQDGYYCQPIARNFESIDAAIAPNKLIQITVGETHPVKQHGIDMLKSKLDTNKEIRFYFVVPPDRYRTFRRQSYVSKKG